MRRFIFFALICTGGCTVLLDADDHRGGSDPDGGVDDGGTDMCDQDGDGFRAESCGGDDCDDTDPDRYPGAPPICGNDEDESCPGDPEPPVTVADESWTHGVLRPTTVLDDDAGYLPEIALAGTTFGGGAGTALVFAGETDGSEGYRPMRWDVPLADLADGSAGPLITSGGTDLTAEATITSLDARTYSSDHQIGAHLMDSANDRRWHGILDLAAGTSSLSERDGVYLDGPGMVPGATVWRAEDDMGTTILDSVVVAIGGGIAIGMTDENVPTGDPVRMVTTDSNYVMLQDESTPGTIWLWQALSADPALEHEYSSQEGKAAWVRAADAEHVLAIREGNQFRFVPYECEPGDSLMPCVQVPTVGSFATAAAGPEGGDAWDGHAHDDGPLFVFTLRYEDGDVLILRRLDPTLFSISAAPVTLLDLRGTGQRVADARMDVVHGDGVSTLAVAASVRDGDSGDADRVVVTGLRACEED